MPSSSCRVRLRRLMLLFGLVPGIVLLSEFGLTPDSCHGGSCRRSRNSYGGLVGLDACQLEQMYACAEAGTPPVGFLRGRLLVMTDFPFPRASVVLSGLAWKGKHIGPDGTFVNQFTWARRIGSKAFVGPSWYDGKPAHVMQYPPGTRLFGNIRDEFREVSPCLYLGLIYTRCPRRFLGYMCMQVDPRRTARPY